MASDQVLRRIVVGVDGSAPADQALEWALRLARSTNAEVIAIFAIPPPSYFEYGAGYGTPAVPVELDEQWRAEIRREFEQDWCKRLIVSGVPYQTVIEDGRPASVIADVAERLNADLVVVGRRGRGGVAELLLGSVSHELSHNCTRPVVLISPQPSAAKEHEGVSAAEASTSRR